MLTAWLRFFRFVNVPTVPGDVLVGAGAVLVQTLGAGARLVPADARALACAAAASVFVYLYGLADNDLCGAATDRARPISEGLISPRAARVARALCWLAALGCGAAGPLPPPWWAVLLLLLLSCAVYNRTKRAAVMGLCRGLNVLAGAAALPVVLPWRVEALPLGLALVWTLYIAGVTRYSEGEETDPARKRVVGILVGALVYLQLIALLAFALRAPATNPLLLAGALLLVLLRFFKLALPRVSAS